MSICSPSGLVSGDLAGAGVQMSLSKAPIQTCNPEPGDICSSSLSLMLKRVQIHRDPPMDMEDAAGPSQCPTCEPVWACRRGNRSRVVGLFGRCLSMTPAGSSGRGTASSSSFMEAVQELHGSDKVSLRPPPPQHPAAPRPFHSLPPPGLAGWPVTSFHLPGRSREEERE